LALPTKYILLKNEFVKSTNMIFEKSFEEFINDFKNWLKKEHKQKNE